MSERNYDHLAWVFEDEQVSATIDWFVNIAYKCLELAPSEKVEMMISHKVIHTRAVIDNIIDIHEQEELEIALKDAVTTAISHDTARLPQALLTGTFSDKEGGFIHALVGAHMFRLTHPMAEDLEYIAQAIEDHSMIRQDVEDMNPLTQLIRDADKLTNLEEIETWFTRKLKNGLVGDINPDLLETFKNQEPFDIGHINSLIDTMLFVTSWLFDINFDITRELIIRKGIPKKLTNILESASSEANQHQIESAIQTVNDWVAAHSAISS